MLVHFVLFAFSEFSLVL